MNKVPYLTEREERGENVLRKSVDLAGWHVFDVSHGGHERLHGGVAHGGHAARQVVDVEGQDPLQDDLAGLALRQPGQNCQAFQLAVRQLQIPRERQISQSINNLRYPVVNCTLAYIITPVLEEREEKRNTRLNFKLAQSFAKHYPLIVKQR